MRFPKIAVVQHTQLSLALEGPGFGSDSDNPSYHPSPAHTWNYIFPYTYTYMPLGLVKYSTVNFCFFICKIGRIPPTFHKGDEIMCKPMCASWLQWWSPWFTVAPCQSLQGCARKSQGCGYLWGIRWWLERLEGRLLFASLFIWVLVTWANGLWEFIELDMYVGFARYITLFKSFKNDWQQKCHNTYLISDFHYAHAANFRILTWLKMRLS